VKLLKSVGVAGLTALILEGGIQLKIPDSLPSSGLFYFPKNTSKLGFPENKKSHAYARDFLLSG
jgi:hypothetical protein